jgi:hypothetical protein
MSLQTPENRKARPENGCKNESKKISKPFLFIFCIERSNLAKYANTVKKCFHRF